MFIVACVLFWYKYMIISDKNKRRLNNQDISNNDQQAEAYSQDGEGSLENKSVKEDTKDWRGEADNNKISYWHKRYGSKAGEACCWDCEPIETEQGVEENFFGFSS